MDGRVPDRPLREVVLFDALRLPLCAWWALVVGAVLAAVAALVVLAVWPLLVVLAVAYGLAWLLVRRGTRWARVLERRSARGLLAVGGLLLAPALLAWRVGAVRERAQHARHFDAVIDSPYRRAAPDAGVVARSITVVGDPASWRDAAYFLAATALSLLTTGAALVIWVWALNDLAQLPNPAAQGGLSVIAPVVVGTGLLIALPRLARRLARTHLGLARGLLGPTPGALTARLAEQQARRRLAVEAAENERRRIERDLHDGAQQRLVALVMDLGMARQKLPDDPAAAQDRLARAHAQARQALVELRSLARGIHPAVLADRGLDAALSALAANSPVPVEITVDLPDRPAASVESAAYFVVAEALTNIARHAAATTATVTVTTTTGRVHLEIHDDGRGGADPATGTGLTGLSDRVSAMNGHLSVTSPPGGPTTVTAEIPCTS